MISLEKRDATSSLVVSLFFLFLTFLPNLSFASHLGEIGKATENDSSVVVNQTSAELYISYEASIYGQKQLQNVNVVMISATEKPASQSSKKILSKTRIKRKVVIVVKAKPSSLSPDLPKYNPGQAFENSFFIPSAAVFVAQNQNPVKKYLNGTSSLVCSESHNSRRCQMVCRDFYDKEVVQASRTLFINRGPPFQT